MDAAAYWNKKITGYAQADWANKPSLFVIEAESFFPKKNRVLELGCGPGYDGIWLATQGYTVTQTDFIEDFFPAITQAAKEQNVTTELQQLDARELAQLSANSYDVVFANLSLHYFDLATTKQIFAEIHRILKPGGVFAGLFNSTDDSEYGEGEETEKNFYHLNGIDKRFLDVPTACMLTKDFTALVVDNQGTTYKDQALGVKNLIRIIVKK